MEALLFVSGYYLYQQYRHLKEEQQQPHHDDDDEEGEGEEGDDDDDDQDTMQPRAPVGEEAESFCADALGPQTLRSYTPEEIRLCENSRNSARVSRTTEAAASTALMHNVYTNDAKIHPKRRNTTLYEDRLPAPQWQDHSQPRPSASVTLPMSATEYAAPVQAPRHYQPGWMRSAGPELVDRKERDGDLSQTQVMNTQGHQVREWQYRVDQTMDPRGAFGAHAPMEPERVRPPGMGGYDGYTADRGRMPIPRYNQYALGEELTSELADQGRTPGFAANHAARSALARSDAVEIMPSRMMQHTPSARPFKFLPAGATRSGGRVAPLGAPLPIVCDNGICPDDEYARDSLMWDQGPSGSIAHIRRPAMPPTMDPTSVHNADGSVVSYATAHGTGQHADIQRPTLRSATVDAPVIAPVYLAPKASKVGGRVNAPQGGSASVAADTSKWQFSFAIKDLLQTDTPAEWERQKKTRDLPPDLPQTDIVAPPQVVTKPAMLAPQPPKPMTMPDKKLLFSDEERADYKLDTSSLDLHRPNVADRTTHISQGSGQFKGVSQLQVTSVQFEKAKTFEPGTLVNSRLKNQTADAPVKELPQRRPQNEFVVEGGFMKKETTMAAPKVMGVVAEMAQKGTGVGKDQTHVFPSSQDTPENTLGIRADKRAETSLSGVHLENAAKFTGASRPVQSVDGQSFSKSSDAGIDYGNDILFERGGALAEPLRSRAPNGPTDRIDQTGSMREVGEFRRR